MPDDDFGMPLNPPGFETMPHDFQALASGDESVLAASGLDARAPSRGDRSKLLTIGLALAVGGAGLAGVAYYLRSSDRATSAPTASSASAASRPVAAPTPSPSVVVPVATPKPKPKPALVRPLAGTSKAVTKGNSSTLGSGYTLTLPTGWTAATGIRNDRSLNLDLRMRNAARTHSLTLMTLKPALVSGRVTAVTLGSIKAALLKGEKMPKTLPGTPTAQVGGTTATGYDVSTTSSTGPVTIRTVIWRRGTTTYAAIWRAPSGSFPRSLGTLSQLLASVKYGA